MSKVNPETRAKTSLRHAMRIAFMRERLRTLELEKEHYKSLRMRFNKTTFIDQVIANITQTINQLKEAITMYEDKDESLRQRGFLD